MYESVIPVLGYLMLFDTLSVFITHCPNAFEDCLCTLIHLGDRDLYLLFIIEKH